MNENCPFCQIVSGKEPAEIVYTDEQVTVFQDRHPAAPVHLLIVPNRHITSLNQTSEEDELLLGHMLVVASRLAEQRQISQTGYRLALNTGADGGQTVFHLHIHLLGGRALNKLVR